MLHIVGAAYKEGEFYGSTVAQFGNYSFNACMAGHTF